MPNIFFCIAQKIPSVSVVENIQQEYKKNWGQKGGGNNTESISKN
jgi:hypothetical protein